MNKLKITQEEKYFNRVVRVLKEQNFIVGARENKIIKEITYSGRRYFFMVANRIENGKTIERFVKIPQNNTKKLLDPFKRQIEFVRYVKSKNIINTRNVIDYNYNHKKGLPFLVMDTLPTKDVRVGFILKNKGTELLGEKEAKNAIDQIEKFHSININEMPANLKTILKKHSGGYKNIKRDIMMVLGRKVKPYDFGKNKAYFHKVLEKRLNITDFKSKIKKTLDDFSSLVDTKENNIKSLVHGDMAPNNVYVYDSSKIELLDMEWVGVTNNKIISMVIDYGNFRERAWVNKGFQRELDNLLMMKYRSNGKENLGSVIIKLSIIRSALQLSRYFENYDPEKQKLELELRRKKSTEEDILYALNF